MKVIITGSTGMVGEGVLNECINCEMVTNILLINRKESGTEHSKVKEIIHKDFHDFSEIKELLKGYDACFFCAGVSSVGLSNEKYYDITYTLTMSLARIFSEVNSDSVFCYVSGAGTDSSEKGKLSWARVKGKTENDLKKLPFKKVFSFRPGYLQPTKGLKRAFRIYKILSPVYPVLRKLFPNQVGTLEELGKAMINAASFGYDKGVLEVRDIRNLSERK